MAKTKLCNHSPLIVIVLSLMMFSGCEHSQHAHGHNDGEHGTSHKQHGEHSDSSFTASHIKKQATITLNGPIVTVWPLFDPLNEGKWAAAWQPEILYPTDGTVKEGMVCRTHGMKGDKGKLTWMVTRYDAKDHRITYAVNNPERVFTVDVQCSEHDESHTDATITYNFVGLTESGNEANERTAEKLFRTELQDWQNLINHYLETGKTASHEQHGDGHSKAKH